MKSGRRTCIIIFEFTYSLRMFYNALFITWYYPNIELLIEIRNWYDGWSIYGYIQYHRMGYTLCKINHFTLGPYKMHTQSFQNWLQHCQFQLLEMHIYWIRTRKPITLHLLASAAKPYFVCESTRDTAIYNCEKDRCVKTKLNSISMLSLRTNHIFHHSLYVFITWLAWLLLWWFLQCMKNHA